MICPKIELLAFHVAIHPLESKNDSIDLMFSRKNDELLQKLIQNACENNYNDRLETQNSPPVRKNEEMAKNSSFRTEAITEGKGFFDKRINFE